MKKLAVFNSPKITFFLLSETSFLGHILKNFSAICHQYRAFGMDLDLGIPKITWDSQAGKVKANFWLLGYKALKIEN